MTLVVIPLSGGAYAAYTQTTSLDGKDFSMLLEWNWRCAAWFLSLFDSDGAPVLESQKLVIDADLLHGVTQANRPVGKLILLEISGAYTEATFESLGTRHQLHYLTP